MLMLHMARLFLSLLSLLLAMSCTPTSSDSCDSERCDLGGNGGTYPTRNANVKLLRGYNTLYDRADLSTCVTPLEESKLTLAGGQEADIEVMYVESRSELARELGLDLSLGVKYAGIGEGNIGVDMLSNFNSKNQAINLLVKLERHYKVVNQTDLRLDFNVPSAGDEEAVSVATATSMGFAMGAASSC
jgi:hypothetical protein